MTRRKSDESQIEKFKEAARELGVDESEEAFNEKLRRIAKSPPPKDKADKKEPGK